MARGSGQTGKRAAIPAALRAVLAVLAVLTLVAGCVGALDAPGGADGAADEPPGQSQQSQQTNPQDQPSRPADSGEARAALDSLPVRAPSERTAYDRAAFGQPWLDADRDGCDTRNDVLGEQLTSVTFKPGTRECKVVAGVLADPYTGARLTYDDAAADGSGIDVDHVVALAAAWRTGASARQVPRLAALANDPLNLLAVDAGTNRAKGSADASEWLPPRTAAHCHYVARQVAVKQKYGLWLTPPEAAAIRRVLARCPGQELPADSGAATEVSFLADDGERSSCADLAARGLTPVRRGDPAYDPGLDGDGDGVACE